MLAYYGARFPTTEINYSFRRIPSITTLSNWSAQTPANFRFSLKAPQEITHFKKLRDCGDVLTRFCEATSIFEGKTWRCAVSVAAVFAKGQFRLDDFLALLPRKMKCAFEFRHSSWIDEEIFMRLRSRNAALCIADSEKLGTSGGHNGRFRLLSLSKRRLFEEGHRALGGSDRRAGKNAKNIFVYFRHEESGLGLKLAKQLIEALG